jgi:ribosomal-protein-serine acetyltransferase
MLTRRLTDGCHLRLLEESDAPELYRVIEANRAYLARWLPWAAGQTLDDTLSFIRATRRQIADNDGLQVAVVDEQASIIGIAGFHHVSWANRSTSIGYWLVENAQGRGTMTRVVSALVEHAIHGWNLNRVEIQAGVENSRSRAIPERLGFVREGLLRQVERVGDRYVDAIVYSALGDEWPTDAARIFLTG